MTDKPDRPDEANNSVNMLVLLLVLLLVAGTLFLLFQAQTGRRDRKLHGAGPA